MYNQDLLYSLFMSCINTCAQCVWIKSTPPIFHLQCFSLPTLVLLFNPTNSFMLLCPHGCRNIYLNTGRLSGVASLRKTYSPCPGTTNCQQLLRRVDPFPCKLEFLCYLLKISHLICRKWEMPFYLTQRNLFILWTQYSGWLMISFRYMISVLCKL